MKLVLFHQYDQLGQNQGSGEVLRQLPMDGTIGGFAAFRCSSAASDGTTYRDMSRSFPNRERRFGRLRHWIRYPILIPTYPRCWV